MSIERVKSFVNNGSGKTLNKGFTEVESAVCGNTRSSLLDSWATIRGRPKYLRLACEKELSKILVGRDSF